MTRRVSRAAHYSDAFCLFYDAKTKTVKAMNGSGRSPKALTIDYVREQGVLGNSIPASNLNCVTVPGPSALYSQRQIHRINCHGRLRCGCSLGRHRGAAR